MKTKLVISMLGLGLVLGGCSQETSKVEDKPITEDKIVEDTSQVVQGNVDSFSSDEKLIKVVGETYDISRIEDIDALSTAAEVSINYVIEDDVKYATSFEVLKTKQSAVETPVTQEAKGTFVGWVDTHAVAINVDGEEKVFQTTWYESEEDFNNIAENDTIGFEYIQENETYYITKISIGEASTLAEVDASGTFVGWADNHTVMIEENGEEVSYQTDKMEEYATENDLSNNQIDSINDGEEVTYTYLDGDNVKYLLTISVK